jgi:hypothetical protein
MSYIHTTPTMQAGTEPVTPTNDELVGHAGRNGYLELDKDSKSNRNVAMNMI